MGRIGSKGWLLFLVVPAVALAVGWRVWVQPSARTGASEAATIEPGSTAAPPSAPPLVGASEGGSRASTPGAADEAASPPQDVSHARAADPAGRTVTLVATFARPDKSEIEVDRARVDLVDAAGVVRRTDAQHATRIEIEGLAAGPYTIHVEAPGYIHREQTLDVHPEKLDGSKGPVHETRIFLWPEDWIAVLARTSDGRPFSAVGDDLGLEPKTLFAGVFRVHTRLDAPARNETDAPDDPSLARFRPPSGHQAWEVTRGCVGSLQLLHPAPIWVGLDVFGTNLGWEFLPPGRSEIVFRLDLPDLEARFARVALRVVDEASRAPVEQALVTLRADDSAHRRKDQGSVPTGSDGRLELARVVPGRYEI